MQSFFNAKPERNRIIKELSLVLKEHTSLWLSLSLLFLWTAMNLLPSFVTRDVILTSDDVHFGSWIFALFSFVLSFFIIGLISRKVDFDFRSKRLLVFIVVLMSLGVLMCTLAKPSGTSFEMTVFIVGLCLLGGATPIVYIEIVRQFMRSGFKVMLSCGAIATLLSSSAYFALSFSTQMILLICSLCIPLAMCACLLTSFRTLGLSPTQTRVIEGKTGVPWKLLTTAIVQGAAFGVGQAYLVHVGLPETTTASFQMLIQLSGFVVAAFSLLFFTAVFTFDFNLLIYKIGFILLAVGLFLISIGPLRNIGLFSYCYGYRFIDLLIFTLVVFLSAAKNISLNWIASWPTCLLYIGFAVGYGTFKGVMENTPFLSLEQMVSITSILVLLATVVLVSDRNVVGAWGSLRPSDDEPIINPHHDQAVENFCNRLDFSPRQRDVFILMCLRMTRKEIAGSLYISEETVKIHIRNIYQKMTVHTRNEFMTAFEAEEKSLARENGVRG